MTTPDAINRRLAGRKPSSLVGMAAAFLIGVLLAAVLVPDRNDVLGAAPGSAASATRNHDGSPAGTTPDGGTALTVDGAPGSGTGGPTSPGATGPVQSTSGARPGTSGSAGSAAGGSTGPGVSASSIKIGFGLPDLSAIGALGPGYDQGDPKQHVEGILKELRAEGRLPVHGRDITPIYSSYNILSADAQRATCETFGIDNVVFAVIAIHDFGPGNECTAREFKLPTFTSDGSGDAVYARSAPNLFTMQMSSDRLFRNFVAWADRDGLLTGKRIGVYYPSDPAQAQVVKESIINPIKARGRTIVSEVQTADQNTGGPTDAVAVQRFSSDRVDTAILIVSAIAKTNFFNQAQAQGFKPRYLENDAGFSTTDTATSTYPKDHFDGTAAFTGLRFGEPNSGLPEPAEAQWCRAAIKKQTGNDIPRQGRDAEYIAANQACDEILTVLHGLEQAGPTLTREAFIRGVETIRNQPAGIHGNLTFTPQRHDGTGTWRRIDWTKTCSCWKVKTTLSPLLVG
ncbi:MAG: hypothetical protein ABIY48_03630 [Acidimicrobiales bacterium]